MTERALFVYPGSQGLPSLSPPATKAVLAVGYLGLDCRVVATGQHREMFHQVAEQLGFAADADLDAMQPNQTLATLTARLMEKIDGWLDQGPPDLALVQGDTRGRRWVIPNEPQLAFENLQAPAPGNAPTDTVHYTAAEMDRQIELIYEVGRDADIPGSALVLSSAKQEASRNVLPTLTVAMNTLPPGFVQPPHRHNSVAVSLIIQGEGCFSLIDGVRKDWAPWATTVTPGVTVHSHHNGGAEQAKFLIIQDGGIYYHARAMGFEFADHPDV